MRYVYFHGFASSPRSRKAQAFRAAFDSLGLQLEIPNLDGDDFEHITITSQLQLAEALLRGDPACLIGSSMGGYLAALYASLHPEVSRLVLLAPAFSFSARWEHLLGPDGLVRWRQTNALEVFHYGEQRIRPLHFGLFEDSLLHPAAPLVSQPGLIIHGIHDDVVPIELSRDFAASHPSVSLLELDSDHELLSVLDVIIEQSIPFLTAGGTTS